MESLEELYYENPKFWDGSLFTEEDTLRFEFVARHVPVNTKSLCDVGCGNGLFLQYLAAHRPELKLHGIDRSRVALSHVTIDSTRASIDDIPVGERSFDTVSCMEVIEHLPESLYRKALPELARVAAQYVMISVPLDQDLRIGRVECSECKTLFNPDYHFRSFTSADMPDLLKPFGFKLSSCTSYGANLEFVGSKWISKLKNDLGNRFPVEILCPACGHTILGRAVPGSSLSSNKKTLSASVKEAIKRAWPKSKVNRWVLAVYERETG